ncbi:MAG: hypothetical protein FJ358_00950 [Thaumarchaeota archaeon]|nr:hypothetical protein [Nitrososphaerota archaeon]
MSLEIAKQYEGFVKKVSPEVAELLGVKNRKVKTILASTVECPVLGITSGRTIFLNAEWFKQHPDDYGTIVHEIAHAVMNINVALELESWLIEGLADYARVVLGYPTLTGTSPDYDPERLFEGYEPTAHFFLWIRKKYGDGEIKNIAKKISEMQVFDVEELKRLLQEYRRDNESL